VGRPKRCPGPRVEPTRSSQKIAEWVWLGAREPSGEHRGCAGGAPEVNPTPSVISAQRVGRPKRCPGPRGEPTRSSQKIAEWVWLGARERFAVLLRATVISRDRSDGRSEQHPHPTGVSSPSSGNPEVRHQDPGCQTEPLRAQPGTPLVTLVKPALSDTTPCRGPKSFPPTPSRSVD